MLIFSVATLSIMLFYSIVIAANVHKTLDKDNAGKLLRVLFPSYFLSTAILSLIALIFSIIEKSFINTILLFLILQISGNISSKKNFAKLHTLSVSINLLQIIILIILIINNLG